MKFPVVISRGYAMRRAPSILGVQAGQQTAPLRPRPQTLVIIGSSNAAGMGATGYTGDPVGPAWTEPPTSWAGLLRASLTGWTVINRSISGTGTQASIDRFLTDVAQHSPSHVILCTSPANDAYNARTWAENTRKLIRMVRDIGAIPIVRGPSCHNSANAAQIAAIFECQRELEMFGVQVIDALSPLSDPAAPGKLVGGGAFHIGDGLHNNDAGYAHLDNALDRGIFRYAADGTPRTKPQGAWSPDTDSSTTYALQVSTSTGLSHALRSFTMRARIGGHASGGTARAFMAAYALIAGDVLRVRNPASVYELFLAMGNGAVSAVNPISDTGVHDLVVVARAAANKVEFYIDGALVGTALTPPSAMQAVSTFYFGGRESGAAGASRYYRFADCQLWGVPLSADAIADMARSGYAPRAGLVFDGDMSMRAGPAGTTLRNIVPNGASGALGIAWNPVASI